MYQSEIPYFIVCVSVILFTPFLPNIVLIAFDNIIIRILSVIILLYLISIGPSAGIFGLLALICIYLERNRRKVVVARGKLDKMDVYFSRKATVQDESKSQTTVPVPSFDIPLLHDEIPYLPGNDTGTDDFYPVGKSINEKILLETIQPGVSKINTQFYEQHGFGHLPNVETMQ